MALSVQVVVFLQRISEPDRNLTVGYAGLELNCYLCADALMKQQVQIVGRQLCRSLTADGHDLVFRFDTLFCLENSIALWVKATAIPATPSASTTFCAKDLPLRAEDLPLRVEDTLVLED